MKPLKIEIYTISYSPMIGHKIEQDGRIYRAAWCKMCARTEKYYNLLKTALNADVLVFYITPERYNVYMDAVMKSLAELLGKKISIEINGETYSVSGLTPPIVRVINRISGKEVWTYGGGGADTPEEDKFMRRLIRAVIYVSGLKYVKEEWKGIFEEESKKDNSKRNRRRRGIKTIISKAIPTLTRKR